MRTRGDVTELDCVSQACVEGNQSCRKLETGNKEDSVCVRVCVCCRGWWRAVVDIKCIYC